jgi:hypothetical protein
MLSPEYFRRQADICVRLSLIASDDEVSNRLITMARAYMAKGEALAKEAAADAPPAADRAGPEGGDPDQAAGTAAPDGTVRS